MAETKRDYSAYPAGVTVEKDPQSPTGHTAVFIYEDDGKRGEIAKVEVYSDCMMLFKKDEGVEGDIKADFMYQPEEFEIGMAPAGGGGPVVLYREMEKVADGKWAAAIPLTNGACVYNFRITAPDGTVTARLDDPANPTIVNTATGIRSLSSMVYVPYDPEKEGIGEWVDRHEELPRTDGKVGTLETVAYTGADGTQHGLAVYLPYGYDPDRAEPYKVLYLSHGTSGDVYGDELRWMNEGAVINIMDNLAPDFVVVTMNNQQYSKGPNHQGPFWEYAKIEEDQFGYIMPYVESHYNVAKTAEGRAYAGLSMGGATTSNMFMQHPKEFAYYGIWSYANDKGIMDDVTGLNDPENAARVAALDPKPHVMCEAGRWDFGLQPCRNFAAGLTEMGYDCPMIVVPAAHDWNNWQMIFCYCVKNFFFR